MIPRISYRRWRSGRSGPVCHPSQDLKRDELVLGRMESVQVERLESVKEPITIRSGPHPEHTKAGKQRHLCSRGAGPRERKVMTFVEALDQVPEKDSELLIGHI